MKLIECPRDAMQGMETFIPTEQKVRYLNQLLQVGFDTLDCGSFVSPKAIPQLRDTAEVLPQLKPSATKLLVIVANTRGAREAVTHTNVTYLGFPLSISETFQQRNTNKSIAEALNTLEELQALCVAHEKILVTYISMGFGNPYGDPYSVDYVLQMIDLLNTMGVSIVSLADTVGAATPDQIRQLYQAASRAFPALELGAHLHSSPAHALAKIEAAHAAGCQRFDGALKGFGGCPMAKDELVGNLATETILTYLDSQRDAPPLNREALAHALTLASEVFAAH
ncbi:MAG: hydroxymethylglutaryl-CoA lyase [Cyclobacteriaceae bacterium]|nr:hydroxymethylglutaryl-CoA lyase [Cyclobacteriaceae bacterium]